MARDSDDSEVSMFPVANREQFYKKDDRATRNTAVEKLALLSDVIGKSELGTQNKLLSNVIYKHNNQLRKYKTLQCARRVLKMIARLNSRAIIECLNNLQQHMNNACNCIWNKANLVSCSEKMQALVNQLLCKVGIIYEILRSCKMAIPWTMVDLRSRTFLTFNMFMLSHLCRVRTVTLRIYELFVEAFKILELLQMTPNEDMKRIISFLPEILFENESLSRDTKVAAFSSYSSFDSGTKNLLESSCKELLMNQNIIVGKKLFSRKNYSETSNSDTQNSSANEEVLVRKKSISRIFDHSVNAVSSTSNDIGISVDRNKFKELLSNSKPDLENNLHKNIGCPSMSIYKQAREKKVEVRCKKSVCNCWKCQQTKKYFGLNGRANLYLKRPSFRAKYCQYMQARVMRRRKQSLLKRKARTEKVLVLQDDDHGLDLLKQSKTPILPQKNAAKDLVRLPSLPLPKLDEIDLIFDDL